MKPRLAITLAAALFAAGCATTQYPATPAYSKYSVEEIVRWSRAGEPPERIVERLRSAAGFYPLTATEIVRLHGEGVSLQVLDWMQRSYVQGIRHEERFQLNRRFGE